MPLLNSFFKFILDILQRNLFRNLFHALLTFFGFIAGKEIQEVGAYFGTVGQGIQKVIEKQNDANCQKEQPFVVTFEVCVISHVFSDIDGIVYGIPSDCGPIAVVI